MSEKRKDSKGRVLKTGESQRKDGIYQYRYKDNDNVRRTIYAGTLQELRNKEKEIEQYLSKGISYYSGSVKLRDAIEKLFSLKRKWKDSTRHTMQMYLKTLETRKIYNMPINKIKVVDCKELFTELYDEGYSFGSISSIRTILKMTFDMACENDVLAKNPCSFPLKDVIDDNTPDVVALTEEQEKSLLNFLQTDTIGKRYYNTFVILLGTGMRISEYAALTKKDIDFDNNCIHVNKQITKAVGELKVTSPKSKNAYRDIPMTNAVRWCVMSLINNRDPLVKEVMIDGHVGFLNVTRSGRPRCHSEYADNFRKVMERYNKQADIKIERCTPHVLRHTFCTKCIAQKMDVKTVQYLMGHSDASITLNIYADEVSENIQRDMTKLVVHCG